LQEKHQSDTELTQCRNLWAHRVGARRTAPDDPGGQSDRGTGIQRAGRT
jgi:hypothetical protein